MEIRLFEPEEHFPLVYRWWRLQTGLVLDPAQLSDFGFIVYSGDTPVAATWLFIGPSKVAHLELMLSDPELSSAMRKEGLQKLVVAMMDHARDLGIKYFLARAMPEEAAILESVGFCHETSRVSLIMKIESHGNQKVL